MAKYAMLAMTDEKGSRGREERKEVGFFFFVIPEIFNRESKCFTFLFGTIGVFPPVVWIPDRDIQD